MWVVFHVYDIPQHDTVMQGKFSDVLVTMTKGRNPSPEFGRWSALIPQLSPPLPSITSLQNRRGYVYQLAHKSAQGHAGCLWDIKKQKTKHLPEELILRGATGITEGAM